LLQWLWWCFSTIFLPFEYLIFGLLINGGGLDPSKGSLLSITLHTLGTLLFSSYCMIAVSSVTVEISECPTCLQHFIDTVVKGMLLSDMPILPDASFCYAVPGKPASSSILVSLSLMIDVQRPLAGSKVWVGMLLLHTAHFDNFYLKCNISTFFLTSYWLMIMPWGCLSVCLRKACTLKPFSEIQWNSAI